MRKIVSNCGGTGIGLGRASSPYLKRIGKRQVHPLLPILYASEIDAFFDIVAALNTFSGIETFRNYLFEALVSAGSSGESSQIEI